MPSGQEYVKNYLLQEYRWWVFIQYHRTRTLSSLKARFWGNRHTNPQGLSSKLWYCLCEDQEEGAEVTAQDPSLHTATAVEFEQSNILLFCAYRGWKTATRHLRLADAPQCHSKLKDMALCEAIESYHHDLVRLLLDPSAQTNAVLRVETHFQLQPCRGISKWRASFSRPEPTPTHHVQGMAVPSTRPTVISLYLATSRSCYCLSSLAMAQTST